eukprot:NODE_610_length_2535_cov_18.998342_g521_i0.p1 GENE.NODE_610_length_2535_cov_18.998342_g521_i0~~NODE_610_length_2535_cov_18.998342_g521_i0.p1  ORF type:complete len:802 (+),score=156.88 NODE_610_length_2535_cov_18.998342_g521_i0:76-2481(+)
MPHWNNSQPSKRQRRDSPRSNRNTNNNSIHPPQGPSRTNESRPVYEGPASGIENLLKEEQTRREMAESAAMELNSCLEDAQQLVQQLTVSLASEQKWIESHESEYKRQNGAIRMIEHDLAESRDANGRLRQDHQKFKEKITLLENERQSSKQNEDSVHKKYVIEKERASTASNSEKKALTRIKELETSLDETREALAKEEARAANLETELSTAATWELKAADLQKSLSEEMAHRKQVEDLLHKGLFSLHRAAGHIQRVWRGCRVRSRMDNERTQKRVRFATKIQSLVRGSQARKYCQLLKSAPDHSEAIRTKWAASLEERRHKLAFVIPDLETFSAVPITFPGQHVQLIMRPMSGEGQAHKCIALTTTHMGAIRRSYSSLLGINHEDLHLLRGDFHEYSNNISVKDADLQNGSIIFVLQRLSVLPTLTNHVRLCVSNQMKIIQPFLAQRSDRLGKLLDLFNSNSLSTEINNVLYSNGCQLDPNQSIASLNDGQKILCVKPNPTDTEHLLNMLYENTIEIHPSPMFIQEPNPIHLYCSSEVWPALQPVSVLCNFRRLPWLYIHNRACFKSLIHWAFRGIHFRIRHVASATVLVDKRVTFPIQWPGTLKDELVQWDSLGASTAQKLCTFLESLPIQCCRAMVVPEEPMAPNTQYELVVEGVVWSFRTNPKQDGTNEQPHLHSHDTEPLSIRELKENRNIEMKYIPLDNSEQATSLMAAFRAGLLAMQAKEQGLPEPYYQEDINCLIVPASWSLGGFREERSEPTVTRVHMLVRNCPFCQSRNLAPTMSPLKAQCVDCREFIDI